MLVTLALVILCSSIVVFFAQEFRTLFVNIFAIKGVKLVLPLLIASWLIYAFQYWALLGVSYFRELIRGGADLLMQVMPFQKFAEEIAHISLLFALSIIPVLLIELYLRHRTHKGYKYRRLFSALIFVVSAILLLAL